MAIDLTFRPAPDYLQRDAAPFDPSSMYYHASREAGQIERFRPFTHFGVAQAALDRTRALVFSGTDSARVYEVSLQVDPARVLRVADLKSDFRKNTHGLHTLTDSLHYDHEIITSSERERVYRAAGPNHMDEKAGLEELAKVLVEHGHDAIVYTNEFEARGSESVMILQPELVTVVREFDLAELESIAGKPAAGARKSRP